MSTFTLTPLQRGVRVRIAPRTLSSLKVAPHSLPSAVRVKEMEAESLESIPHRKTLERAPVRCLAFLLGVGRSPAIRGRLATRGYTVEEHHRGWSLLRAVDPMVPANDMPAASDGAEDVRACITRLDRWDNQNLPIADLALRKRCPAVHTFVFGDGLAPAVGPTSVRVVGTFLARIDAIAEVAANDGTKSAAKHRFSAAQARDALSLLDSRGIDAAERASVHAWLATAQQGAEAIAPTDAVADDGTSQRALVELHEWITEWSLIARKVLKRRADLIALGLAEKRPRKKPRLPAKPPSPA